MSNQTSLGRDEIRGEDLLIRSVSAHAIYMLDMTGAVSTWNRGACIAKGYTADDVLGRHFSIFYRPEDQETGEPQKALEIARELGHYESEGWRVRKNGECFWASVVIDPVYEEGVQIGFVKVTRDISRHHEAEVRLARATRNLEISLTHMCQGLVLYDSAGQLILTNQRLSEIFSLAPGTINAGMAISSVMSTLGFSNHRASRMQSRPASLGSCDRPYHSKQETKNGRVVSIATQCMPEGGWVSTFEDVTERERAAWKLEHLACHDALTGLPNRKLFRTRLEKSIAEMKRGIPFALLLLDLKDFSLINDAIGEAGGDELLQSFASRVEGQIREVDCLARLDGDEFAILQCDPESAEDTEALAFRLMKCFSLPHAIRGQLIVANVNVGIAIGSCDGSEARELLRNADLALCRAKLSLLPSYNFFDPEMDRQFQAQRKLENDLQGALMREEFTLHYQPISDAQTARVKGYEALLRWCHPSRGWISPAEFVPLAEKSGQIVSIGEWVLRTACMQAATWTSPLNIAVNLSPVQFQDGSLPGIVADVLATTGLDAHRLELEITESLLLKDDASNLAELSQLRELGVRISLDDFGTGYSSLSYLRSFHFDKLKIDRSFVRDLPHEESARAIVAAITGLGKSFGIVVVAEGVENFEQLRSLQQQGCDEIQGYLLGRPQPAEELLGVARKADGLNRSMQHHLM